MLPSPINVKVSRKLSSVSNNTNTPITITIPPFKNWIKQQSVIQSGETKQLNWSLSTSDLPSGKYDFGPIYVTAPGVSPVYKIGVEANLLSAEAMMLKAYLQPFTIEMDISEGSQQLPQQLELSGTNKQKLQQLKDLSKHQLPQLKPTGPKKYIGSATNPLIIRYNINNMVADIHFELELGSNNTNFENINDMASQSNVDVTVSVKNWEE